MLTRIDTGENWAEEHNDEGRDGVLVERGLHNSHWLQQDPTDHWAEQVNSFYSQQYLFVACMNNIFIMGSNCKTFDIPFSTKLTKLWLENLDWTGGWGCIATVSAIQGLPISVIETLRNCNKQSVNRDQMFLATDKFPTIQGWLGGRVQWIKPAPDVD